MQIDTFTVEDHIDIAGHSFIHGDPVIIDGEMGKFTFISKEMNNRTGAEWINVRANNGNCRSFRPDRIKVKKTIARRGKLLKDVVCIEHPTYTARRTPRKPCARCWAAYEANKK